jgi:AcrR family transcriptional regulator
VSAARQRERAGGRSPEPERPAARGRHAPPPSVRLPRQRERLLRAAAEEFAARGYAGASSESIIRRAGMSKATFYEHFANKEECMLALFDRAAEVVLAEMARAAREAGEEDARARLRAGTHAFLTVLAREPAYAQTLLVEIIGAGPAAAARRDRMMEAFAAAIESENEHAASRGLVPRFASPHDAYAIVGAIAELVSRQVRRGIPAEALGLAPVIERLILGVLGQRP